MSTPVERRELTKTPHEIAVIVAHQRIAYGELIGELEKGMVLQDLKRVIFRAVRDAIAEHSKICEHEPSN